LEKGFEDAERFRRQPEIMKKIAKTLGLLERNPLHPGMRLERIVNDATAWAARVDRRYRISFDPEKTLPAGNPDWSAPVRLLRFLDHDDLYRYPR
jgi:hypothetical protein